MINKKTKIPLPFLKVDLEIPFVRIYTEIMGYSYDAFEYHFLRVHFQLHKWSFHVDFYKPDKRILNAVHVYRRMFEEFGSRVNGIDDKEKFMHEVEKFADELREYPSNIA